MSSEDDQKLKELIRKRGHIKASLTRMRNFAESFDSKFNDVCELAFRQEQIPEIWKRFDDIQSSIEILELESESAQSDERGVFEATYYTTRSLFQSLIKSCTVPSPETIHNSSVSHPTFDRIARLPPMSLPTFGGDIQKWTSFFDSFCALVHLDVGLSDVQKLYYLRSCLTGTASDVIQSISATGDNYNIAVDRLKDRYENKTLIIQSHIRALLNLPKVNEPSAVQLRHLHHMVTSHVQSLQALGEVVEYWDAWLVTILLGRLDKTTASEWILRQSPRELPTYCDMEAFISNRCIAYEANEITNPLEIEEKTMSNFNDNKKRDNRNNRSYFASKQNGGLSCPACNGNHRTYTCEKFKSLNISDRYDVIRKIKGCFNCLGNLHMANNCKSEVTCRICGQRHHSLLHYETKDPTRNSTKENVSRLSEEDHGPSASTSLHSRSSRGQILLATAQLNILDYNGEYKLCRAVLDSGSQVNFISERFAKLLRLPLSGPSLSVKGIGDSPSQLCPQVHITIFSRITNFSQHLRCHVLPIITDALPVNPISVQEWNLPAHITSQLADPGFHNVDSIDMLLGAEIFFDLLNGGIWDPGYDLPIFRETKLGWIVSGRVGTSQATTTASLLAYTETLPDHCISDLLSEYPTKKRSKIQLDEEKCAYDHFMTTYRRNDEGRFIVQLPKKSIDKLGESKFMARSRFFNLERKLSRDIKLASEYKGFMQEYLDMGHMELISEEQIRYPSFYLPHHAIVKESSITTKTRVVFDASAKSSSGLSLNDVLMCGPTVQDDLFSILLRFRIHKFVLCADIEKMYRQVVVDENDCCLQLVLWRFSPDQPLSTYRLRTVTYGEKPASFLATQCIKILANDVEGYDPEIATLLRKDFYVDDLMTGANTLEESERIQIKIADVLAQAKMPLRKWCSNSPELLKKMSTQSPDPLFVLEVGDQDTIKSLGLLWNPNKDSFHFFVRISPLKKVISKRCLLSDLSRVFDPLGFLTPVLIKGKIFIQQLWQVKITWDEPLPEDLQKRWLSYYKDLKILQNLSIPRRSLVSLPTNLEIHGFCDASQNAFGACLYLKSQHTNGEWNSRLLCSKSRVAPLHPTTIPRLELCGAVLLIELAKRVSISLSSDIKTFHFWTDSMVVMSWIRGNPAQWKTYVSNRVMQILNNSNPEQWDYVKSEDNPADLVSRGIGAASIIASTLWWHGPNWLSENSHFANTPLEEIPEATLEIKKVKFVFTAVIEGNELLERYSTWNRLLRITAWARRFINNSRTSKQSCRNRVNGYLTVNELAESAHVWCRYAQGMLFEREIRAITNGDTIHKNSKIRCLNPYIDVNGLVRVGGRLTWAPINNEQINPILLPASHIVTQLLFEHFHKKQLHCGPQALLAQIRQQYWPLNGRNLARVTVHKCVTCFHAKPKSLIPMMAPLPKSRVQLARPFTTTGVDFAGPILIRSGIRRVTSTKAYIAVFVCFSTRAVHLELVHGLTAGDFLAALRRFMSRRGYCAHIYSDNATNFIGARRELRGYFGATPGLKGIDSTLTDDGVNWHFIPPGSPHFGGMWEAAVKSAKHHLKRVVKNSMLTAEQMNTLLTQIEACLNSRPITPLSTEPSDFQALTPGHFLIGGPLSLPPEPDRTLDGSLVTKWIKVQCLLRTFWKRWTTEYFPQLQKRGKWHTPSQSLTVGDFALLKEENLSPTKWKLVRIKRLHPGTDGITRVVTIQNSDGNIFRRPVIKMCPLPIENQK